jgi:hypothetical protein
LAPRARPARGRGRTLAPFIGAAVATLALTIPPPLRAQSGFHALFDVRLLASDGSAPWLEGGLDKQRFGRDDAPLRFGQALLSARGDLLPSVSVSATLAAYDGLGALAHVTEAALELHPVPRSAWRWRARAGFFYPPISEENVGPGWTSPYTLSFSAINTWIAEEIRTQGAEVELTHMGRFSGAPDDVGFFAATFRGNDPAGALLSWRGWALHDRQTGWREVLPLPDLPAFGPTGSIPPQQPYDKPFVELDGRWGYYAGVRYDHLDGLEVRAFHYDNLGDPSVLGGGQWAWRTRFDHLGARISPAPGLDFLFQALGGDTEMDGFVGPLVYAKYWAAYTLASVERGPWRTSARLDVFGVRDEDTTPNDPNQEHGGALTLAYFHSRVLPFGTLRIGGEIASVRSARPARRLVGLAERQTETTGQLSLQWLF